MLSSELFDRKAGGKTAAILAAYGFFSLLAWYLTAFVLPSTFLINRHLFLLYIIPAATGLFLWINPKAPVRAPGHYRRTRSHHHFPLLAALLTFAVLAVLAAANLLVHLRFMNSADENSCHFLSQLLLRGQLWAPAPRHAAFFETPHIGIKAGKWFSVYPPGWPLVWALAMAGGIEHWINPILTTAAAGIFMLLGERVYGPRASLLAGLLMLLSPFFIMTGSAYMSHGTCLFTLALFLYAAYCWTETRKPTWALVAGLSLGYAAGTRYLTAAAFSLPVLLYLINLHVRKKIQLREGFFHFVISAGALVVLHALWNQEITGAFWNPPNHYLQSHEKLGFIAGYTPGTALVYLLRRFVYLLNWTPPLVVFLFLFALMTLGRRQVWYRLLAASAVSLMLAYMLYYSWGGHQYGPRYYFEAYPVICLMAAGILDNGMDNRYLSVRRIMTGVTAGILIAAIPILIYHGFEIRHFTRERAALYERVNKETLKPSLVFIKGYLGDRLVMSEADAVRNSPFLDTPVIYAHDRGLENGVLCAMFPERTPYLAFYDRNTHTTVLSEMDCGQGSP